MAGLDTGFRSHLTSGGLISGTNCDVEDSEGLEEVVSKYMKSESFRADAQRVLKAHSIDPSTVKKFHISVEANGLVYLTLPSTGRKIKLSTDTAFAEAAFAKVKKHATKTREDLVSPMRQSPAFPIAQTPQILTPSPSPIQEGFKPVSPSPIVPQPIYPPASYPSMISQQAIIGYVPNMQGGLIPIYSPSQPYAMPMSPPMVPYMTPPMTPVDVQQTHPQLFREAFEMPTAIHADVTVDNPFAPEKREGSKSANHDFIRHLFDHASTEHRERASAVVRQEADERIQRLRATDRVVIKEYLENLETERDRLTHLIELDTKEIEDLQKFSLVKAVTGTFERDSMDVEELQEQVDANTQKLSEITLKIATYKKYLALPDGARLDEIQARDLALISKTESLTSALQQADAEKKDVIGQLQKANLDAELQQYENITPRDFILHFEDTRPTYAGFQELLDSRIYEAETAIEQTHEDYYSLESSKPFWISTVFSRSKSDAADLIESRQISKGQERHRQYRLIAMYKRLKKTEKKEYDLMIGQLEAAAQATEERDRLEAKLSQLERQIMAMRQGSVRV